jgi:hypothetical protein
MMIMSQLFKLFIVDNVDVRLNADKNRPTERNMFTRKSTVKQFLSSGRKPKVF